MTRSNSDPRAAVAAIFARQFCVISRRQALESGLTVHQVEWALESSEWTRVHEGVYRLTAAPVTYDQRLLGACLATNGWASHRSAALLRSVDVPAPPLPEILTTSRRELDGVLVHRTRRLADTLVEWVGPFPATTPARTLLDLAGVLRRFDLETALDSALRQELVTLDRLERCIDGHGARGWSGAARLRELIDDRRNFGVTRSPLENRLWRRLANAGVKPAVRNHLVRNAAGEVIAEIDIAWPDELVGIECQSYEHHFGRQAWRRDQVKHNVLTALGWIIFPATNEEAGRMFRAFLTQIRRTLSNRGA